MKTTFTILLSLFFLTAFAQTQNAVEQDLLRKFDRILYWRDYRGESPNVSVYDSLFSANEQI